jgi:hypothetical protein
MLPSVLLLVAAAVLPQWHHRLLLSTIAATYLAYGTAWAVRRGALT